MADTSLNNKYFVKKLITDNWQDIATAFDGVKILSLKGFNEVGEAVNVFTQQWITSQKEDFMVTLKDANNKDLIIRKNVDLEMTFIAGTRYASNGDIYDDRTQEIYDSFVDYITRHGDFYIRSAYTGHYARVVCLQGVKVTTEKLHRVGQSYIMATATLHVLDAIQ